MWTARRRHHAMRTSDPGRYLAMQMLVHHPGTLQYLCALRPVCQHAAGLLRQGTGGCLWRDRASLGCLLGHAMDGAPGN